MSISSGDCGDWTALASNDDPRSTHCVQPQSELISALEKGPLGNAHTHTYMCMFIYIHNYTYIRRYMYAAYVYIYIYIRKYLCDMCLYIYICTHPQAYYITVWLVPRTSAAASFREDVPTSGLILVAKTLHAWLPEAHMGVCKNWGSHLWVLM